MHVYAIAELSRLAGGAISIRHLQRFSHQRRAASDLQAPSRPLPSPHPALSQRERRDNTAAAWRHCLYVSMGYFAYMIFDVIQ
jgi:hypothetical protein